MQVEWKNYCRTAGLKPLGEEIEVTFDTGRRQKVSVEENGDAFHLVSTVARQAIIVELPDASLRAWRRNRSLALVGFRVDGKGRMIGEAWVPKAGLTAIEFQLYVRTVATECDRFEHQLTGRDVE